VTGGGLLSTLARLGRMTYEDATELGAVFAQVASRQARDTLTAAERLAADLVRSADRAWRDRAADSDQPPT
jgi:hypothetical protein